MSHTFPQGCWIKVRKVTPQVKHCVAYAAQCYKVSKWSSVSGGGVWEMWYEWGVVGNVIQLLLGKENRPCKNLIRKDLSLLGWNRRSLRAPLSWYLCLALNRLLFCVLSYWVVCRLNWERLKRVGQFICTDHCMESIWVWMHGVYGYMEKEQKEYN